MTSYAWMLRQDGKYFKCNYHLYGSQDIDMWETAAVAMFIIHTNSKDIELAEEALDTWLAVQVAEIADFDDTESDLAEVYIDAVLDRMPYKFEYMLSTKEILSIHTRINAWSNIRSLIRFIRSFTSSSIVELCDKVSASLNQQFCRVRYGGKYDYDIGSEEIWFRISSIGFNWVNVIYQFTSEFKNRLNIRYISVCRDYESDLQFGYIEPAVFYKAKDGTLYDHMPIDEFLTAEHENNPVFTSASLMNGPIYACRCHVNSGGTFNSFEKLLKNEGMNSNMYMLRKRLVSEERNISCAIDPEFKSTISTKLGTKLSKLIRTITDKYPEIIDVDINYESLPNLRGKDKGFELSYTIRSYYKSIDGLTVTSSFTKPLNTVSSDVLLRFFSMEYLDYLKFRHIEFDRSED